MFKPVHGVRGTLPNGVTAFADAIVVDDVSIALLKKVLKDGDYTYLMLRTGYAYEIVRTTGFVGNSISVSRAQDGTTAQAFPAGAQAEFVMSQSAIADVIDQQTFGEIELTGSGIVTVTRTGPNQYLISAPAVTITSESPNVLVGGEFPNFVLSTPEMRDCCD